jgi:anaerobic ribonucleoside-triphosphate reductase activating protein
VADATKAASIEEVLEWIAGLPIDQIDGFTLTGGEPFDQPNALLALAQVIRRDYGADGARDILVYSGYPWRRLTQRHAQLLDEFDMVISEPFKQRRPGAWLRGSDNQAIHALTELGSKRYGSGVGDTAPQRSLQVHFDGEQLWMIGIPAPGDLERMEAGLRDSGVTFGEVSWG